MLSLLGRDENDFTSALGCTMARCGPFAAAVLDRVWPAHTAGDGPGRAGHLPGTQRASMRDAHASVRFPDGRPRPGGFRAFPSYMHRLHCPQYSGR